MGACRYDIRRKLEVGDHIFVISGSLPNIEQFVMGGFEIDRKIPAIQAYDEFPEQRLHKLDDGQLAGNIIVDSQGMQHSLDNHSKFSKRVENYLVGRNPIALTNDSEIDKGRKETMEALCEIFKKRGKSPIEVVGRNARNLNGDQVHQLRHWLNSIKTAH